MSDDAQDIFFRNSADRAILRNCLRISICLPVMVLIVVLTSLFPTKPYCTLQQFYIPVLNKTLNSSTNTTLTFTIRLENLEQYKGVYYDPINVTFFDSPNRSNPIANFTIPKFYQGFGKVATKGGVTNTSGIDREAIFRAVSANGSVVFRVDMSTLVRFKIAGQKSRRHKLKVGANVLVSDQGTKLRPNKDTRLKSKANKIGRCVVGKWDYFVNFFVLALVVLEL